MSNQIQFFHAPPSINGHSGGSPSTDKTMDQQTVLKKFVLLVSGFLLVIFGALYFLSPYSEVAELSVEGSNEVLDQQVINSSRVQSGDSLWGTFMERNEIERQIVRALPQISEVSLTFSGLNNFTFEIEEYRTVAYLQEEGGYVKVLENGEILDNESVNLLGNHPVFLNFEEGNALERIIGEFQDLEASTQDLISEVEYVESEHNPMLVRAYMNNGNQVIASIPTFAERMNYYPQMVRAVEGQQGVFDLEAGAFFIPFENNDPDSGELDEEAEVELEDVEE